LHKNQDAIVMPATTPCGGQWSPMVIGDARDGKEAQRISQHTSVRIEVWMTHKH